MVLGRKFGCRVDGEGPLARLLGRREKILPADEHLYVLRFTFYEPTFYASHRHPSAFIGGCVSAGLLALALLAGCVGQGRPAALTVFVSGDSRGYLEPCGCRRDQAGGLPGRATI